MPDTLYLRLLCRGATQADKNGRFATRNEPAEPLASTSVIQLHPDEHLLSAPEPRARELARQLWPGKTLLSVPELAECDMGQWCGRRLAELSADDVSAWLSQPDATPHGGESQRAFHQRVAAWLDRLALAPEQALPEWGRDNLTPERVPARLRLFAVTHASVIRAAISYALNAPLESAGHLDIEPLTCVTLTYHRQWRLRLRAV